MHSWVFRMLFSCVLRMPWKHILEKKSLSSFIPRYSAILSECFGVHGVDDRNVFKYIQDGVKLLFGDKIRDVDGIVFCHYKSVGDGTEHSYFVLEIVIEITVVMSFLKLRAISSFLGMRP